jgi:hypothetical protein
VEARCAEFGDRFDRWQAGAGKVILAKRANGEYAATVGGVVISIPRQVVKTFLVGRIVFALCTLFPGLRVLWTAHHGSTIDETFKKLRTLALSPRVLPFMAADPLRESHGEQEIRFANGSVIRFGARGQGFALGFDKIDIVVFDEAQRLTERALDDMVATTAQSEHEAGALIFYMGTPPRPQDQGEVFKARRREALEVERARQAGDVDVEFDGVYIETSADRGCDPDDREQWKLGNPSFRLGRTPLRSMLRLRKNLLTVAAWMREGLGVWDADDAGSRAIDAEAWSVTGIEEAPTDGLRCFGVAFSRDGDRVALAGALRHDGGAVHGELLDAANDGVADGLADLADWLAKRWRDAALIVLSGKAGSPVLAQLLRDRKVPDAVIKIATTDEYTQSNAMLVDAVAAAAKVRRQGGVLPFTHLASEGQAQLDESVAVCDKKAAGPSGAWRWFATTEDGDETPVEALSLAHWAARTTRRKPYGNRERKAVIL